MVQGQGLTRPPYPPKVRVPVPLPHGVGWCGMDIARGVVNVMPYCKCYGIGNMLVTHLMPLLYLPDLVSDFDFCQMFGPWDPSNLFRIGFNSNLPYAIIEIDGKSIGKSNLDILVKY